MTETTEDQNTISITRRCVESARDALRQAEAEHTETEKRRDTFIEILKAGKSLPKGKTLAGVEDELILSSIKIEGLAETLATAEDAHAQAIVSAVASQVKALVEPLTRRGNRTEEAVNAIASIMTELVDEQKAANSAIQQARIKLKTLDEGRYGPKREVNGVYISPGQSDRTIYIDGFAYSHKDPKRQVEEILAEVEKQAKRILIRH